MENILAENNIYTENDLDNLSTFLYNRKYYQNHQIQRYRTVGIFEMKYIQNKGVSEISENYHISINRIYQILRKAKRMLIKIKNDGK